MALGDAYVTNTALKTYLAIGDTDDDTLLTSACVAATEWVNQYTQRQFNKTTSATARVYVPRDYSVVEVDDFHTITDLAVKTDTVDDGTYATTWSSSDYVLEPFDGIEAGMTGFPYRKIRAVESKSFLCRTGRPRVQVTAQWGWNAIPESVTLATKIVAAYLFNLKDSPLGVASFGESGLIRVRDVPQAAMLLQPYAHPVSTGPLVA
jgi:hypothetical protein